MPEKAKVPAIRFKGFTDAWEQRKFKELAQIRRGLTYNPTNVRKDGVRVLRSSNINEDTFVLKDDDVFVELKAANIDFVKENDILITSANGSNRLVGKHALVKNACKKAVHGGFMLLATAEEPEFTNSLMSSPWYEQFINVYVAGGNGAIGNLSKNDLEEQSVFVPIILEQKKIGEFFASLDNLITLHQRKLLKLKNVKKAMLEKMFPKNGNTVPEIRFAGFTDAWEQRKFKELAQIRRGLTYNPTNVRKDGVRVLRSSNINEDTFVLKDDDVFVELKAANIDFVKENDILITSANGSNRLVGKHALVKNACKKAVHGGFMLLATAEEPEFTNSLMSSPWYEQFINVYVAGGNGAIGNLSKNDLEEQSVFVPIILEQKKIGEFFASLDNLITLHQRKYEKLQNLKKACLEKMFV